MNKLFFTWFVTLFTVASGFAQTGLTGRHTGISGMMAADMNLKNNGTYTYKYLNWESGNGRVYYGKFTVLHDTLFLMHNSYRKTAGAGRSGIRIKLKKTRVQDTLVWLLTEQGLYSPEGGEPCLKADKYKSQKALINDNMGKIAIKTSCRKNRIQLK